MGQNGTNHGLFKPPGNRANETPWTDDFIWWPMWGLIEKNYTCRVQTDTPVDGRTWWLLDWHGLEGPSQWKSGTNSIVLRKSLTNLIKVLRKSFEFSEKAKKKSWQCCANIQRTAGKSWQIHEEVLRKFLEILEKAMRGLWRVLKKPGETPGKLLKEF